MGLRVGLDTEARGKNLFASAGEALLNTEVK
jgi:hypothetical protein